MWLLSQIGAQELMILILAVAVACCFGRKGIRWLAALGPLLMLAALLPFHDILSMLIAFTTLLTVFALGVFWGPRLFLATGEGVQREASIS
jgi:hypothetical protein